MKKYALKAIAAFSAAAVMMSACPYSAVTSYAEDSAKTAAVTFDANSYCTISGKANKNIVTVSWSAVKGADSYSVYRDDGTGFKLAATAKSTSYTDKKAKYGHCYRYRVYAVKGKKKSAPSEVLHVGLPKKGSAVIYVFDIPVDYEAKYKRTPADFDIYDSNRYEEPVAKKKPNKTVSYDSDEIYEADGVYTGEGADMDDEIYDEPCATPDYDYEEAETAETAAGDDDYDTGDDMAFRPNKRRYYYNGNEEDIKAGTLTAGRLNDNKNFGDYQKLAESEEWQDFAETWDISLGERYTVLVTDGKNPIPNKEVVLRSSSDKALYTARTDNKGYAYLFAGLANKGKPAKITVDSQTRPLGDINNNYCKIVLEDAKQDNSTKHLDLMLTIDSTGSMSDEMKYIEAELKDVVKRVSKNNKDLSIRISVNFYRDKGDAYIVRSYKFRTSADTVTKSLGYEHANGGGDYPEAVHTALDVAVNKCGWQEESTKIMFMVLDAPPHEDNGVAKDLKDRIRDASAKGIRIVPVISSGGDEVTEYLLRAAAAATGGTYLFLTDDSGVGGSHSEPKADQYEVKKLNDLMVEVINEYLK